MNRHALYTHYHQRHTDTPFRLRKERSKSTQPIDLLVEQIDQLTHLRNSDWITLKKQHERWIVSMDVPSSWPVSQDKTHLQNDPITRDVITAINNMLTELMAAMSHKDWLSRRQRQNWAEDGKAYATAGDGALCRCTRFQCVGNDGQQWRVAAIH